MDTEGCIGQRAAADVAADNANVRDTEVRARLGGADQPLYDDWARALTIAGGRGLVYGS